MSETPPESSAAPDAAAANPDHLREIELEGKRVHLLGTAHISARSAQEVVELIDRVQPDTVCVELCAARHQSLVRPEAWREMDLFQVVRQKRATVLLANLILASFQHMNFNEFFFYEGRLSIFWSVQVGAVASTVVLWFAFRKHRQPVTYIEPEKIESWIPTIALVVLI